MAWLPGQLLKLTKGVSEAMPFIRGLVRAGRRPTESYNIMRKAGIPVQKQNFLDAFRAIDYAYGDSSVYLPSNVQTLPREDLIPISPSTQARTYRNVVGIDIYDRSVGETFTHYLTIDEDKLMSEAELVDLAAEIHITYGFDEEVMRDTGRVDSINFSDNPIFG